MITGKLRWLLLEAICILAFGYFGSIGALALAFALALVPLLGWATNLIVRKKLLLKMEAPSAIQKGDEETVTVVLHNPTVFLGSLIRMEITAENQLNRQKARWRLSGWVGARKKREFHLKVSSRYCGCIRISAAKVKLYDAFGLIGTKCALNSTTDMVVQPDTFAMTVALLLMPDRTSDSEEYSQERPGQDLTETYQLREYVPGDSPQQIHWKLTSKFDRLIVRDPALQITRNVLVFWERTGQSEAPDIVDAQVEVMVSLCRSLLDAGVYFTVGWNDTRSNFCVLHEIRNMDELVGIIHILLRATGTKQGISGAELLMQTQPEALCPHMVYIAETPQAGFTEMQHFGHVTALICGDTDADGAISFSPENYQTEMAQIEL